MDGLYPPPPHILHVVIATLCYKLAAVTMFLHIFKCNSVSIRC